MSSRKHLLRHGPRMGVLAASIGALIATGGLSSTAWAQEEAEDEAGQRTRSDDEVIVTGSRIRRDDFSSPNATSVVTGEDMQNLGVISVADMVNQLPNNIASVSPMSTADSPWNMGASIANLRGMNTFSGTRTLTMVDSKRVGATNSGGSVDMNVIPSALVGRIETVTGGGAASYGADAMAGVVNVILDTNIEGYRLNFDYRTTDEGDGDRYNFSFATGTQVLDGRGQLTVSMEHTDQEPIFNCTTRDFCQRGWGIFQNGTAQGGGFFAPPPPPFGPRDDVVFEGQPQYMILEGMRHTNLPEGILWASGFTTDCNDPTDEEYLECGVYRITPDGRDVVPYFDELTEAQREAVGVESWTGDTPWGLGKSPYDSSPLLPENQSSNIFTRFAYELDNGIDLEADLRMSRRESRSLQKQTRSNQQSFCIREDNAFLQQASQQMRDVFAARWQSGVFSPVQPRAPGMLPDDAPIECDEPPFMGGSYMDDREEGRFDFGNGTVMRKDMSEHLDRENNNKTDTMSLSLTATGDLFNSWTWDSYVQYSEADGNQFIRDWQSDNRMQMALDSVIDPETGDPICRTDPRLADRSYDKYNFEDYFNPVNIVNEAGPGTDIRNKWVTFYTIALAEEYPEADVDAQAQRWFDELSAGCVPFNPFGSPDQVPMSPELKAYAFPSIMEGNDIEQKQLSVSFSGDLHQGIGAGPLLMATGMDWRQEDTFNYTGGGLAARDFRADNLGPPGSAGLVLSDDWGGRTTNTELFAEIEMPFLRDKTAAQYLMLNLANRRTRNQTERTTGRDLVETVKFTRYVTSWKASMVWQPADFVRLRATRSFDMRSPSARELFQTNTGAQQAGGQNELLSPFRTTNPNTQQSEAADQYENITGGNSKLTAEESITETLGLVFTPVGKIPGLEVAVDYYETYVDGGIDTISSNGTLNRCFNEISQGVPTDERIFCPNMVFGTPDLSQIPLMQDYGCEWDDDEDPTPGVNACTQEQIDMLLPYTNIVSIASSAVNVDPMWNRGVDLSLSYSKQLSGGGFLSGRVLATRFLEQSVDLGGNRGRTDVSGQTGSNGLTNVWGSFNVNYTPTPRISGNAFVSYNKNAFTVTGQVRYIGTGRLNIQDNWIGPGECTSYLADGVSQVACFDPNIVSTVSDGSLPSWATLNMNFNYDLSRSRFQLDRFEEMNVFLNIENVGNRTPNFFSGRSAGGINSTYFNGMGRQYNVGVRMQF